MPGDAVRRLLLLLAICWLLPVHVHGQTPPASVTLTPDRATLAI